MANREEIDLVVKAIAQGFGAVSSDMRKLNEEQKRQTKSTKEAGSRFTELASKLSIVQQAYGGVAEVVKRTAAAINEGAQLQLARGQFDRLSESIDTTSESLLVGMREATSGMMSDAELIAGASDIISLGLADSEENVVRLSTSVGVLGLDMQQVILTFANNSKARLDALGLSVEDVTKKAAELEAQGFVGDAFDEAVMIGLEEKMELLGDTADTTAGKIMKLESSWANLTNTGKEFMAVQWEPIIGGLVNSMDAVEESTNKGRSAWLNAAIVLTEFTGANTVGGIALRNYVQEQKEASDSVTHYTDTLKDLNPTTLDQEAALRMVAAAQEEVSDFTQGLTRDNDELSDKIAQTDHKLSDYEISLRRAEASSEKNRDANEAHAESLEEIQIAADEAAVAQAQLEAQTADMFNTLAKDNELLDEYNDILGQVETTSVQVAGRTSEQNEVLDALQSQYERAQGTIRDYQTGVKGLTLDDEQRNEKISQQQELMGLLQEKITPLLAIQSEYNTITSDGTSNTELLNQKIFEQIQANSDNAAAIAIAGQELGIYSQEEAEALLNAALLEAEIKRQAEAWDGSKEDLERLRAELSTYIGVINEVPTSVNTTFTANYVTTGNPNAGTEDYNPFLPGETAPTSAGPPPSSGGGDSFEGSPVAAGASVTTINVDARGATDPAAIEQAVNRGMNQAGVNANNLRRVG